MNNDWQPPKTNSFGFEGEIGYREYLRGKPRYRHDAAKIARCVNYLNEVACIIKKRLTSDMVRTNGIENIIAEVNANKNRAIECGVKLTENRINRKYPTALRYYLNASLR